ncbi:MAG: hypothetical protein KF768_08335 [Phycisphaeraceae bacterium]|nr:hypothetical protein [Phycisphaeraceae bacterium]
MRRDHDRSESQDAQELSHELNSPPPERPRSAWSARPALLALGRTATWAVLAPARRGGRAWARLRPAQQLVLGFASYVLVGVLLLYLPFAQSRPTPIIDNAFNVVSAISTTGLTTVSVADHYTTFGEFVVLALFQLGGIGYMTLTSLIVLARGGRISETRLGVLKAGFSVPHYFVMQRFIVHVVVFTLACEAIGAAVLWWRFSAAGIDRPLWSAVFHSVSAFATAGFSLNDSSLEAFRGDWVVNLTIGALSYFGAIGYIVVQDVWYSLKLRERLITFTSKVILTMTAAIFVIGSAAMFTLEPSLRDLPAGDRLLASMFQTMTASTTAGFNTVPIGSMAAVSLVIVIAMMLVGASPSGTGGGIKTTSVSALLANLVSVLRGRSAVVWMGHEVPMVRVLFAVAAVTFYVFHLGVGVAVLAAVERHGFLHLVFESASALGTVGLSMGITGDLSYAGKLVIMFLMFAGRCGPLTIGLALLRPDRPKGSLPSDDLAV